MMRFLKKHNETRRDFDVLVSKKGRARNAWDKVSGAKTLNLRPKFRARHPWIWAVAVFAVLAVAFAGIREFSTRAEVHDFNPSTCLGNWQNPANAEGGLETLASASTSFSADNSAVYIPGTQIFCGGFLPTGFATSGTITNVGLTLVWRVGDAPSGTPPSAESPPENSAVSGASSPDANASSSDVVVPDVAASSTPDSSSTGSSADASAASSSTDVSTPSPAPSSTDTNVAPSPTGTDGGNANPDTSAPPPVIPPDDSSPSPAGTSFLSKFISVAFADDAESATVATATVLGPPLIANLAPSSSSPSSTVQTDATATAFSTIVPPPPPPPDENFLNVSYSTDGQTWIGLGRVDMGNWQRFTVTLPISDWTDLQNLQIKIEGIPTTQDPVPPVYLDGMLMEVHDDVPSVFGAADTASSTAEEIASTSLLTPAPPVRITLDDSGAGQTCNVEPFSQALSPSSTAQFEVELHPSISGVSYDLLTGYLPRGVSVSIGSPTGAVAATSSLVFQAVADAQRGSFNIPVIYREHEADGTVLSNFCQLNIVVR